ncbi:MAG: methyltransferase domain-containing protein [Hyphomicrobium sp.]|uniref:methyltransferase domain-containing protein n=1 Tax=Hyphomicrobium sp. TaxID=82 RepID=UPI001328BD6E|nr:methyltransferase domain-containing protein [Hyphomicrobium sp.]KAB2943543.1 MAG: methyltransferase domain-containing protein [Hyphomicrobium sp.]MBZ0209742.1 methyltransferase domain-containing protein [Hyphomicrobium sp.]
MLKATTEVVDPVCGMTVVPDKAAGTATYKGKTYYFCSTQCVAKFKANPQTYVREYAAPAERPAMRALGSHPIVREPVGPLWVGHQSQRAIDQAAVHTDSVTMGWAAPFHDALCSSLGIGRSFRRETLRLANIATGDRVLDVGCGTGVLTRLAADAGGPPGSATGIDPSAAMITGARRKAVFEGSSAVFRLAAVEELPFADGAFDVVVSSFTLHHLPPEVKRIGLREVYRVPRDGGRLFAVDIDRPANALWWLLVWPLLFTSSAAANLYGDVLAYLQRAGFAPVEVLARNWELVTSWSATKPLVSTSGRMKQRPFDAWPVH